MARRACPNLTLLALITASGLLSAGEGLRPLPPSHLAAVRSQEPLRAARIWDRMASQKSSLGLGFADDLREASRSTDPFGETRVRFRQTHLGAPVYNSAIIGTMDAQGRIASSKGHLFSGINPVSRNLMSEDQVQARVAKDVAAMFQGAELLPMDVEKIVFPTRYQDGLKVVRDPKTRQFRIDTRYAAGTARKLDEYVWAYRVSASVRTQRGMETVNYVVDGRSGSFLKKWDGVEHNAPERAMECNSQYSGKVVLDTVKLDDGTYRLGDMQRPLLQWPKFAKYGASYPELAGVECHVVRWNPDAVGTLHFNKAANGPWGDGQSFNWNTGNMASVNGETAAVDAQFGLQSTWDFMKNVFGRNGIDGRGSAPVVVVHADDGYGGNWQNASWSQDNFLIQVGDGAETGSLGTLDVLAHEFSHGVNAATAGFDSQGGESAGLNESNSDILATATKLYVKGGATGGTIAPSTSLDDWKIGAQCFPTDGALRYMDKPSKDRMSWDFWFDGLGMDDSHFTSGPGNRMFYFLSQGASSDSAKDDYSEYLPSGMTGIGADKAAKIWYRMLNSVEDGYANYPAVRELAVAAAKDLYGDASPEMAAVQNAFAAINVGAPAGGTEPLRLTFGTPSTALNLGSNIIIAPYMEKITLGATVENATNTAVSWAFCKWFDPYSNPSVGILEGDTYTAPTWTSTYSVPMLKATSAQDAKQFALGLVLPVRLDADLDTETDACDLGAIAIGAASDYNNPNPGAALISPGSVSESDIRAFLLGFQNAFGK